MWQLKYVYIYITPRRYCVLLRHIDVWQQRGLKITLLPYENKRGVNWTFVVYLLEKQRVKEKTETPLYMYILYEDIILKMQFPTPPPVQS